MIPGLLVSLALPPLWQPMQPGVWQAELRMAERGALAAVRVVAVRVDPARVAFALDSATRDYGTRGAWTVDRLPPEGILALNTGQFIGGVPWGWVVHEGVEASAPGAGSVAMTFAIDSTGRPALLAPDEVAAARGHVRLAFQSYPMLLRDEELPAELQAPGRGVDLDHRDSRLAIGLLRDGTVVIALTRLVGPGVAGALPWGPTVPEMATFMKSLGCHRAVLLDGGISSQMALRRPDGSTQRWTNWRKVPLGLLVMARADSAATSPDGGLPAASATPLRGRIPR